MAEKPLLPIERYKYFKGFYIPRTKQYFLCDFYEIGMPDNSIIYKVLLDVKYIGKWTLELRKSNSVWKFTDKPDDIPSELEALLSESITNICIQKK